MKTPFSRRRVSCVLSFVLLLIAAAGRAEVRTLTDQFGRSIKADVISVQDEQATIRREDGTVFTIKLSTLTEADQQALRELAKKLEKEKAKIPASALKIEFSRGAIKSDKDTVSYGATDSVEQWAYTVTVNNLTTKELKDLRVEYIVFDKPDTKFREKGAEPPLGRLKGQAALEPIPLRGKISFRTEAIKITKTKLPPDTKYVTPDGKLVGTKQDKALFGCWVRVYSGDELLVEASSPETLLQKEKW